MDKQSEGLAALLVLFLMKSSVELLKLLPAESCCSEAPNVTIRPRDNRSLRQIRCSLPAIRSGSTQQLWQSRQGGEHQRVYSDVVNLLVSASGGLIGW